MEQKTLRSTPSSTNIYSSYKLPTNNVLISDNYKRNFTVEDLNALAYFSSDSLVNPELTPSAAIRDRYYQSNRYLMDKNSASSIDMDDEEDTVDDEEDVLDYRPQDSQLCDNRPTGPPSIYSGSESGSIISLRTEYNDIEDRRSITSIRTVDDRLQGRSLGINLNSFALKTAKRVSRSSTLFRSKNGSQSKLDENTKSLAKRKLEPSSSFVPVRDTFNQGDDSSIKSSGGTSLLSKLSKSTAPVRAKLFAFSALTRNPRMDMLNSSKKKVAESVYNMPTSSPSTQTYRSYFNDRRPSASSQQQKKSSSIKSIKTVSPILGMNLVDEPSSLSVTKERLPSVYPALISKVAEVFKECIILSTRTKDSITYKDVFDGKEAVDKLAMMIKTSDRNLALLLGRALDAQKFFHDVNYEYRLRDSTTELYQFRDPINVRPISEALDSPMQSDSAFELHEQGKEPIEENILPNGVFTILTDCYSPTCTRERLCYSAYCPRRQEQAKQHRAFQRGHSREGSNSYLISQEDRLWINTVPKSILDNLSKEEKKRQENIFELIYTEKDFVDDLNYIHETWIEPLLDDDSSVTGDREKIVKEVFWNILDVLKVNTELSVALLKRQSKSNVVNRIGDIMLSHVANFEPFVSYGSHQMVGKYIFETEKSKNPSFAAFVNKVERLPQSRKLELNGYLTKPTTRLGRYNLLLREILKHTPKNHPDQETIPKAMSIISKFLTDVNRETGKTENRFNLDLLDERLINKNISSLDLDLISKNRQIVIKGLWKKSPDSESPEILVYLLDHCLLIIKPKFLQSEEKYKLHRKPIPLALLSVTIPDHSKRASTIIPLGRGGTSPISTTLETSSSSSYKNSYPISFTHLGKQSSGPMTLYASTLAIRKQWVEKIESQRKALVEKHKVFNARPINESFFSSFNKVNCIASFENEKSLMLGGDQGVYLKKEGSGDELIRILAMDKVSQIDILENSNLLLVLADKILHAYSLDTLLSTETGIKRGRKISSHVSFFKVGKIFDKLATAEDGSQGVERTLVCFVRYNAMTSTIRALEPYETTESKKKGKNHLGRLIRGNNEVLKAYKAFYIPGEASSIQFFKNIICVGSARGFQMVNLSSAEVQSVLDPNDESNNSLLGQHENMKPISMFRHTDGNILLCYSELAFYIDKKGKRVRNDWSIVWEGNPTAFTFKFPYVVAFNSNFIEVRHMDTGDLLQVMAGNNIRCLRPDSSDKIRGVMDDRLAGSELVFELKLIDPNRRKPSMIKNISKPITSVTT